MVTAVGLVNLKLMDIVPGTSTNEEGVLLFAAIDPIFANGQQIRISFEKATPLSSSFLNSSFGELIDKYGLENVKKMLSINHYTPSLARMLKEYFEKVAC